MAIEILKIKDKVDFFSLTKYLRRQRRNIIDSPVVIYQKYFLINC